MLFHRLFSKTMYKNQKLMLGEMSFSKDFIHTDRGDLYPRVIYSRIDNISENNSTGTVPDEEHIQENTYHFHTGKYICRILGQFFPFATYEIKLNSLQGQAGFLFRLPDAEASVLLNSRNGFSVDFCCGSKIEKHPLETSFTPEISMLITCRIGAFDVYLKTKEHIQFVRTFQADSFEKSNDERIFSHSTVAVLFHGNGIVKEVSFYMDCGISQADMRPVRFETGEVMVENGKIYLTMSIRMEMRCYQGIFSWIPGTAEFQLTGALFFDAGDHLWGNDVASSLIFHRPSNEWYLWVCSFSHDHMLAHAKFKGDVRFGVNVVDITLIEKAAPGEPLNVFKGYSGDEDPDFYFDEITGRWHMAICRLDPAVDGYRYFFYESDAPFSGYRCIGQGMDGAETGGSFVAIHDKRYFCCGNSFDLRANYRLYGEDGVQNLKCDYDDGGFRGWGTIIPIRRGSRTRYFWLTFDRHNGSDFNWSYGNIYCFEALFDD